MFVGDVIERSFDSYIFWKNQSEFDYGSRPEDVSENKICNKTLSSGWQAFYYYEKFEDKSDNPPT